MKVEFTDKQIVNRSPYYLFTQLWDKLEELYNCQILFLSSNKIQTYELQDNLLRLLFSVNTMLCTE